MKKFKLTAGNELLHLKLILTLVVICVFGCVMVFSASSYTCSQKSIYNYDSMYMLKKQAVFVIAGFVILFGLQIFPLTRILDKFAKSIYIMGILSIFLLITPLGISSHGTTRWIRIVGVQFQVAEVVKISVIVMMAHMVKKYVKHLANPKLTIRMWIAGGIPAILLFFYLMIFHLH